MLEKSYLNRLNIWKNSRFNPQPEHDLSPRLPSRFEMVPMRDNVRLYTEVFLPENTGPFPVVLHRSPYPMYRPSRHDFWPLSRYLEAGYAYVFQNTRGQYKSEGEFTFHLDDVDDGYDCIEWIAKQDWCNGRVGMEGSSYAGISQLLAAGTQPPALKCIMPTAFGGSSTTFFPFTNGVPLKGFFLQWYKVADTESFSDLDCAYGDMGIIEDPVWGEAFHKRPLIDAANKLLSGDKLRSWKDVMSHPTDDSYWSKAHFTEEQLGEIKIPIFVTGGWLDPTVGPLEFYQRWHAMNPGRDDLYLLIGSWDHNQTFRAHAHSQSHGERIMPANAGADLMAHRLAFFDRYLKENISSVIQDSRVKLYVTGLDQWLHFNSFPPPEVTNASLYLFSNGDARSFPGDGVLQWKAEDTVGSDTYTYDPCFPTKAPLEFSAFYDRRDLEVRSDVLTYTSAPLEQALVILGEIKAVVFASSDCLDTDWFVQISEVFPDGKSISFHSSISALRARYREGLDKEILLTPHEPTRFVVPMGSAGHQIPAGHRIRISIYSAAFPACDPNTNTGNEVAFDTDWKVANQTIYHGGELASHIVLPVFTPKD